MKTFTTPGQLYMFLPHLEFNQTKKTQPKDNGVTSKDYFMENPQETSQVTSNRRGGWQSKNSPTPGYWPPFKKGMKYLLP